MASGDDIPPHSRIFVMCPGGVTETDIRNDFGKFGTIEDVWFVRKKRNDSTELCYVKFAKSSEALMAIDEMNGRSLTGFDSQPIKVIMAANRSEGNVRRGKDGTEQLERLFILVPKDGTEETIRQDFGRFGKITDFLIVKSGRFAYISFAKAHEAALAIEGVPNKLDYKPRIADPPGTKQKREREREERRSRRSPSPEPPPRKVAYREPLPSYYNNIAPPQPEMDRMGGARPGGYHYYDNHMDQRSFGGMSMGGPNPGPPQMAMPQRFPDGVVDLTSCLINNPTRCTGIYLKVNYPLNRETLFKLCNLIPGIEYVEVHKEAAAAQKTVGYVRYNSPASAAWAWEKLQDFEYPPGFLIRVRYTDAGFPQEWQIEFGLTCGFQFSSMTPGPTSYSLKPDPVGYPVSANSAPMVAPYGREYDRDRDRGYSSSGAVYNGPALTPQKIVSSNVTLGPSQPKLPTGTPYVDRCFVVVTNKIPLEIMNDAFSSFGDFIEFYYLGGKSCGYANFGSTRAVEDAIQTLNDKVLYGERIKVIRADPEPGRDRDRDRDRDRETGH